MKAFTVGWFCCSSGAPSLAGGTTQRVGRRERVRRPTFASANTNRVPLGGGARPALRAAQNGIFWGVHIVHTRGFGSGRTGGGLGRIAEVFRGAAEIQGLESGSSPTSGTA